jgi:hypothetical protein
VVQCLPSIPEALGSIPAPKKKKTKKKKDFQNSIFKIIRIFNTLYSSYAYKTMLLTNFITTAFMCHSDLYLQFFSLLPGHFRIIA